MSQIHPGGVTHNSVIGACEVDFVRTLKKQRMKGVNTKHEWAM